MKIHNPNSPEKVWVNTEMPKSLEARANKAAQDLGVSRSAIVRWALIEYLPKIESKIENGAIELGESIEIK